MWRSTSLGPNLCLFSDKVCRRSSLRIICVMSKDHLSSSSECWSDALRIDGLCSSTQMILRCLYLPSSKPNCKLQKRVEPIISGVQLRDQESIVQGYTGKYHEFVAVCIVTSVQHE